MGHNMELSCPAESWRRPPTDPLRHSHESETRARCQLQRDVMRARGRIHVYRLHGRDEILAITYPFRNSTSFRLTSVDPCPIEMK